MYHQVPVSPAQLPQQQPQMLQHHPQHTSYSFMPPALGAPSGAQPAQLLASAPTVPHLLAFPPYYEHHLQHHALHQQQVQHYPLPAVQHYHHYQQHQQQQHFHQQPQHFLQQSHLIPAVPVHQGVPGYQATSVTTQAPGAATLVQMPASFPTQQQAMSQLNVPIRVALVSKSPPVLPLPAVAPLPTPPSTPDVGPAKPGIAIHVALLQRGVDKSNRPILTERFRTKLCRNHTEEKPCPYRMRCMFAHGREELRTADLNFREGLFTESAIRQLQEQDAAARRRHRATSVSGGLGSIAAGSPDSAQLQIGSTSAPSSVPETPSPFGATTLYAVAPFGGVGVVSPAFTALGSGPQSPHAFPPP
jgi:hypothetical protein